MVLLFIVMYANVIIADVVVCSVVVVNIDVVDVTCTFVDAVVCLTFGYVVVVVAVTVDDLIVELILVS